VQATEIVLRHSGSLAAIAAEETFGSPAEGIAF
jgi:hypothetical protein